MRVRPDNRSDEYEAMVEGALDRRTLLQRAAVSGLIVAGAAVAPGSAAAATPKRGGRLRVGTLPGAAEQFDPQRMTSLPDTCRDAQVFNRLAEEADNGKIVPSLAESFEPNRKLDVWTIQLRPDVEWHDGKPFTADDVIYSLRRITDKKLALPGQGILSMIDRTGFKKVDRLTVRCRLKTPYFGFMQACAASVNSIVQNGTTKFPAGKLVGTGPWKVKRIVASQRTDYVRNPNYFVSGRPYLDELTTIILSDSAARFNALLSGQVDVIESIDATQVQTLSGKSNFKVLQTVTGHWVPMCMDVTKAPFTDVRVRQALRLIADRKQIIASATSGLSTLGNDLFGITDPLYYKAPQRTQDIEQAKALLKAAGQEGLTVTLDTADAGTGMAQSALIFSQQAKAAGVTVNVVTHPADTYYSDTYMKTPFFYTDWADRPLDPQFGLCATSDAVYNETQWKNAAWDSLLLQARRQPDQGKRTEMYHTLQKQLFDDGGYLIWGFPNFLDAYSTKVRGLHSNPQRALGFYNFTNAWKA